jgi:hypothetical protein
MHLYLIELLFECSMLISDKQNCIVPEFSVVLNTLIDVFLALSHITVDDRLQNVSHPPSCAILCIIPPTCQFNIYS